MSTAASSLKELHQLQIQLHEVESKLAQGPRMVKAQERRAAQKEAEIKEAADQLQQLRMAADQKNLQLKTNESKLLELTGKLNAATSNREFDIIKSQIEADTVAKSVLEDEILEALDKVDRMQEAVREAEQERATLIAQTEQLKQEVAAAEPGLRLEFGEVKSALKVAENGLPGSVLDTYRRLVQAHGHEALASVHNKACMACHAILSPQLNVDVNVGKYVFCRSCGRLMYRETEVE